MTNPYKNMLQTRCCLNLAKACMMASISLLYILKVISLGLSFMLSKSIGYPFYMRITCILIPDASQSMVKGKEK